MTHRVEAVLHRMLINRIARYADVRGLAPDGAAGHCTVRVNVTAVASGSQIEFGVESVELQSAVV